MLPFNENKKREMPERLIMQQKQWICEQKNLNLELLLKEI